VLSAVLSAVLCVTLLRAAATAATAATTANIQKKDSLYTIYVYILISRYICIIIRIRKSTFDYTNLAIY